MTEESAPSSRRKLPPPAAGSHLLPQVARLVGPDRQRGAPAAAEQRGGQGSGRAKERQEQEEPQHRRGRQERMEEEREEEKPERARPRRFIRARLPRPGLPHWKRRGPGGGAKLHVQGRARTSGAFPLAAGRRLAGAVSIGVSAARLPAERQRLAAPKHVTFPSRCSAPCAPTFSLCDWARRATVPQKCIVIG